MFMTSDKVNVAGLVLAGSADFKTELRNSDMFDPRLAAKVIKIVDVSYGGENGFNQAIDQCQECLAGVKFIQEKKLIEQYFEEISMDTGKIVFGLDQTMKALELGAVETLIVWENYETTRYVLSNPATGTQSVLFLTRAQETQRKYFVAKDEAGLDVDLEVVDKQPLLEWFAENYKSFGTTLEFVTDRSQEGSQFVRGFGGLGGLLRYKVEIHEDD